MKKLVIFLLLLLSINAFSQERVFSVSNLRAKLGESISVVYNPNAEGAKIKSAESMTMQAIVYLNDEENVSTLIEVPMKKFDKLWKSTFYLSEEKATIYLYKFVSGDKEDYGDGQWMTLVNDRNGFPVPGAHLQKASLLAGITRGYKKLSDYETASKAVDLEEQYFPDNWKITTTRWSILAGENEDDATLTKIKSELPAFTLKNKSNERAISSAINWYEKVGDTAKAKEIREEEIKKNPKGKIAQSVRISEVWKQTEPAKRVELLENVLADFPDLKAQDKSNYQSYLVSGYVQVKEYDKAAALIPTIKGNNGSLYNQVAWALIEKGEQLEKAVEWAKLGVDISRKVNIADKPPMMSTKDWEENNKYSLGAILDTYTYGLIQLSRSKEAEKYAEEGYKLMKGEDPDGNARYVECLVANSKYEKAIETGISCIKNGKDNENMLNLIQLAYAAKEGKPKDFSGLSEDKQKQYNDMLSIARTERYEILKAKILKERISKPSVDFTLKDLEGNPVTLSALKGKVVILDFWATWCGPCRSSFPFLQKVYEKYQTNDKVMFLAINTWERVKDYTEQVELAKKFITDKKYTFPVVIDEKFVEEYGVEGIPTKFILDKNGNIAFESIGFNGPEMEDELIIEIETLLAE